MRFRLTTAALLLSVSLAAAGCSQNDKNADPASSSATTPGSSATETATASDTASDTAAATATASASASASGSASAAPSASDTAKAASGEAASAPAADTKSDAKSEVKAAPGILISLPSGSAYKPFMKINDKNAAKIIKLLGDADWEKKESISMSAAPKCKLAELAGDKQTNVYYVWTDDPAAYELVKESGSGYAKLSKKDSAELAKLLPLPAA